MGKQITPTPTFQKVLDYRALFVRNLEVSESIQDEDLFTIYKYTKDGKPCAVGFEGRAKKPSFNVFYRSEEVREERLAKWIDLTRSIALERNTTKASKKMAAKVNTLKVGDVLKLSYGYYGTVVEFYLVQSLVGNHSVSVVPIGYTFLESGSVIPDLTNVLGEKFVKRVNNNSITIDRRRAELIPYAIVNGVKEFKSQFIDLDY